MLLLGSLFLVATVGVQGDPSAAIRLRHGVITTPDPAASRVQLQGLTAGDPVSGLHLIQFTDVVQPEWRDAVAARGVTLLRYVPDNAFLASFNAVTVSELTSLPFVRWVGAYEPQLKVHPALTRHLTTPAAPGTEGVAVKLMISPLAARVEIGQLEKRFQSLTYRHIAPAGSVLGGVVTPAQFGALAASPLVLWIEPRRTMKLVDELAVKIVGGDDQTPATGSFVQQLGYDGRGVTVAVADSGLDSGEAETLHPDLKGRVEAFIAYGGLEDASDEHSHGTHCAGIVAGNAATGEADDNGFLYGLGVAPAAHLVAQRIFDGVGNYYPPASFEQLTHDAVRNGAEVGSNSWGDDVQGQYTIDAAEFDALVRDADAFTPGEQAYVIEFSAGNAGPGVQTIDSPAVAKNVIATGACQNNRFDFMIYAEGQDETADFSSRGPCEDGRIKPDVMAPGTWIASLKSQYASDENAWSPIDSYYLYQGGTSQAGPHAAGAAAVFIQYYRETFANATPSPALVKAALINSATDMGVSFIPDPDSEGDVQQVGDTGPVPNNDEGWGRIDLANLIGSSLRFSYTEQGTGLRTGQTWEKRVVVSPNEPLKITLVYTDVPGLPASIPALVNDLDLEVTGPNGLLYRGNAFLEGESIPGTPVGDRINNVEAVHLAAPLPGEYLVRIRAVNVVEDTHHRPNVTPEQDFALVISGDLPNPGEGMVFFDRAIFSAPGTARVQLIDQQLAGQSKAVVWVTSPSEPVGESLTLNANGTGGAFTNSLQLVTTPAASGDGRLTVGHGETIAVHYTDANPPGERLGEAAIDLVPPVLSSVTATNKFGRTTIVWQSDEPATSIVVYGPPGGATQMIATTGYAETHRVQLPPMDAGQTNRYYVVSADRAGNVTTNDNHGQWYTFITTQAASALLLYTPEATWDQAFGDFLGLYPGIENWTQPLDEIRVPYEIWDVGERGTPTAADLAPFRVVLWRPEELGDLPAGMQTALTAYMAQGGALFVCSYDLLTRLALPSDAAFRTGVLHLASWKEDQGADLIEGDPGDPVGGGLSLSLDYSAFPDASLFGINWPDGVDFIQPTADAIGCFHEAFGAGTGGTVGVRYPKTGIDSTNRVVFCTFPLEAVPLDAPAPDNRVTFLANVLEFLVPGLSGTAHVTLDRPAYSVPGSFTIEVTDTRRAGQNQASVEVQSTSEAAPQTFVLHATVRPGVFRGLGILVPPGTAPGEGRVPAKHGDSLQARYVDAVDREISATATIDTAPPVIQAVTVDAAYNEATILWDTDKATDALVQFNDTGFSFPVNRTAYEPSLATSHAVQLTGLLPDRQYYFQVQSRDEAGNTVSDNNGGQLFSFRTLKPLSPPWSDDLEHGRTGWAVINDDQVVDEDTGENLLDSGWQQGVPVNTEGVVAHSGTQCWGTNLKGQEVSLAISDLISPAVDLTSGRKATLRFWQYYDFTERSELLDIEAGQVAVSKDNGITWNLVYTVDQEFSLGWEEIVVDISPFAGSVVRFDWNYQMFSFDATPRTGWLIDDVSVTLDRTPTGTIAITNNLFQAAFLITGPLTNNGQGLSFRLTNAPIGQYVTRWSAVDFFVTPPQQTNLLTTNAPLNLVGNYTFPDVNHNGISDLFEQAYFQAVTTPHPAETDTDHDGASDYEEFLAGTDPTDPESRLAITAVNLRPNRTIRVEWLSVPGHSYRLELSTNLVDWIPASEWLRAQGTIAFTTLPALNGNTYHFRLEVRP